MKLGINGHKFKVKVQTSLEETQDGMMNKTFDKTFNGMLFIMKTQEHCFWMKNCITPLDIIFIDGDEITKIHHNCQPCEDEPCKRYCGDGGYILEIKGGTCKKLGIKKGDVVTFPLKS
jgi:uncharacterized membrane protein (UPF0127 family)